MKQKRNRAGEALFHNTAVDAQEPQIRITYPQSYKQPFRYDFLYCRGHQWIYWSSFDYPEYLGFETRAKFLSEKGCRWMVVEAVTGSIMWEGGPDDPRDTKVAGRGVGRREEKALAGARAFEQNSGPEWNDYE